MLEDISIKLKRTNIAKHLVSRFSLNSDSDFKSFEITDPLYLPFYYYLGTEIKAKNVLELDFGLGLCSGSFLLGCKDVDYFVSFQDKTSDYYPDNVARHNVKRVYRKKFHFHYGNLQDENFKNLLTNLDLIIIRNKDKEKMSQYLDFAWNLLSYDKLICCDYINYSDDHFRLFDIFCNIRNRQALKFKTRYGVGIITK